MKQFDEALAPLFAVVPMESAMARLTPSKPFSTAATEAVEQLLETSRYLERPELAAGLWLYVDELDRSHRISQQLDSSTGAFWHGIMHRREGDFGNAHYWFRRVGMHPAMASIPEYDPHAFVDAVAKAAGTSPMDLVATQRSEWLALFKWCMAGAASGMRRA
jgi:hypothetical protein